MITEVSQLQTAAQSLNVLSEIIHKRNIDAGWWTDIKTGQDLHGKDEFGRDRRNVPELLALVISEVIEMLEGYRKNLPDDKVPSRSMFSVEAADVMIRLFDILGAHNVDITGAFLDKLEYNKHREDHKLSSRLSENGKKF